MKKLVYLFMMIIGLAFTGCEPMEDLHEEIDAELEARPIEGNVSFTLTEDDYDALDLEFPNFESVDQANELLPGLLSGRYPALGKGSIASVNVDVFNPAMSLEDMVEYTVTQEDYNEMGHRFPNFSRSSHIRDFLDYKYPDATEGFAVELTYDYYEGGSASTRTTIHVFHDANWVQAITLEKEDYAEMGESFPNFSNREDARTKLSTFLGLNFPYAEEDDVKAVIYDLHIGGGKTVKNVIVFTFDGDRWTAPGVVNQTTLQFGHNGTAWEPDNTITYTLKSADYNLIAEALEDVYPDPAWSAGNYDNFDRRKNNRNYWSQEMLVEAIGIVLDNIDPTAEEGQKYVVTFDIYDGSAGTESISVIKQDGEWVLNE